MHFAGGRIAATIIALLLAGCGTSVSDSMTTAGLAGDGKAAVLIMASAPGQTCTFSTLVLGRREQAGFRAVLPGLITAKNGVEQVGEIRLDPGEYHVVSYLCSRPGHVAKLGEGKDDGGLTKDFDKSHASFTVAAGEIVNVGRVQIRSLGTVQGAFSNAIVMEFGVTDWLTEHLARFKQQRPNLHAQMTTRLMQAAPVERITREKVEAKCDEVRKLQAEGKIQNLPPACAGLPPRKSPPAKGRRT